MHIMHGLYDVQVHMGMMGLIEVLDRGYEDRCMHVFFGGDLDCSRLAYVSKGIVKECMYAWFCESQLEPWALHACIS